jgi:general secretion pathway protein M
MMSQYQELKEWFKGLEQREQHLLVLAGVVIGAIVIYLLAFKPLATNLDSVKSSYQSQQALRDWMQVQVQQLKQSKSTGANQNNRGNRSVNVLINQTAAANQIQISRSQPRNENQYQIWLDKVTFSQLMTWLNNLQSEYGIFVYSINISKSEEEGMVRVNLTFQDGA